jgi:D-alanyl-D-alanine carboxypeptidase (penicillin-binding protein 5/6)
VLFRSLWADAAVDGVKTGHTESAGYCLIASRHDGARRLTAVVLGTASDQARSQEALALLHYGSRAFDAVKLYDKDQALAQLRIYKGARNTLGIGFAEDFVLSLPKGVANNPERLKVEVDVRQPLLAPAKRGDRIATLKLTVDGKPHGAHPLVALDDVPVAGVFGRAWDALLLYFK